MNQAELMENNESIYHLINFSTLLRTKFSKSIN